MPTVKDVTPYVKEACAEIRNVKGVQSVHLFGSYAQNQDKPNFIVKDVDIIANTNFDSGDLMAIDNSRYSALRIRPDELEDEGFNPEAVAFTKKFLSYQQFNVDHWATSRDGKLLHWGAIPETHEEWIELHTQAEKEAETATGVKRANLGQKTAKKKEWKQSYDAYIAKFISAGRGGWFPSDTKAEDVLSTAIRIEE